MPTFNVMDYGAVADGVTDTRAAVQAALDAAGTAGGGTVYMPAGTYYLGNMILVPSNVTLEGAGSSTVLLNPPGDLPGLSINGALHYGTVGLIGVANAAVRNLTIDLATNVTEANGVILASDGLGNRTTGATVEGIHVEGNNSHQYLIWNFNADDSVIINNTIDGNVTGGVASEQEGIEVFGGHNVLIQGNVLTNVGANGIYVWEDATIASTVGSIQIVDNVVNGGRQGIFVTAYTTASDIDITGNTLDGQYIRGLYLASSATANLSNVLVEDNTITNPVQIGMWLNDQGGNWTNVVVNTNTLTNVTGTNGVGMYVTAENVSVTNNTITDLNYIGLYFSGASNSSATGNTITDARTNPLYVENSTNVSLSENNAALTSSSNVTATITLADADLDRAGPSTGITINFSSAVPGFEADNVVLPVGASVSALVSVNGGKTWTGTLTVANDVYLPAGTVQITLVDALVNQSGVPYTISTTTSFVANTYQGLLLNAGNSSESLLGGSGPDTLNGGTGNDTLNGSVGNDSMTGGIGNDTYHVDTAGDRVFEAAGSGDDTVFAAGTWTLAAGQAVEHLRVNSANTAAIALTGNELANNVYGRAAGGDTLNGAGGNDRLLDQGGASTLNGGSGNDVYFVTSSGSTVIEAVGGGSDALYVTVNYTVAAGQEIEYVNVNTDAGRAVTGNAFNDWIDGGGGNDTLNGGSGNDYLTGGNGNDSLVGGAGHDTMVGGAGSNVMRGNSGNDTYFVSSSTDLVYEVSGEGTDTVLASATFTLGTGQAVENLQVLSSTVGNIALAGNELANTLKGRAAGGDTLDGGGGNDRLIDLGGAHRMIGGSGNDVFTVSNIGSTVIEAAGGGGDAVYTTVSFTLGVGQEIEYVNLYSSAGLAVMGNELANWIDGGSGNDTIDGGAGVDYLRGFAGNDVITGGAGNDKMEGPLGDGDDTFVFASGWGNDTLKGFDNDHDTLDFTQIAGLDAVSQLTIATLADSSLLISYSGNSIRLFGNVNATTILDDILV